VVTSPSHLGIVIDIERDVDAHQRIDQRRDGDAQGDSFQGHPQIFCLSGEGEGEGIPPG
jgi:hypothetical protein